MASLCALLRVNRGITHIDVSGNHFTYTGWQLLADVMRLNTTITEIRTGIAFGTAPPQTLLAKSYVSGYRQRKVQHYYDMMNDMQYRVRCNADRVADERAEDDAEAAAARAAAASDAAVATAAAEAAAADALLVATRRRAGALLFYDYDPDSEADQERIPLTDYSAWLPSQRSPRADVPEHLQLIQPPNFEELQAALIKHQQEIEARTASYKPVGRTFGRGGDEYDGDNGGDDDGSYSYSYSYDDEEDHDDYADMLGGDSEDEFDDHAFGGGGGGAAGADDSD
mmetsp:Transcript_25500/g.62007  ORF Transcript_25500/g.62007 Transcript_25500/m.62007 type:complete len:283 (-) Transcript_25500:86-934(-)